MCIRSTLVTSIEKCRDMGFVEFFDEKCNIREVFIKTFPILNFIMTGSDPFTK